MSATAFFSFPGTRRRMYAGPLGSHVDDYIALLQKQSYVRHSIRCKVRTVAAFSRWLDKRKIAMEDVGPDSVARFLTRQRARKDVGANSTLRQMIELLQRKQLVPAVTTSRQLTEQERAEDDFRQHMLQARGLSRTTVSCYQRSLLSKLA